MFETILVTLESVKQAQQLIFDLRATFAAAKALKDKLALYQAATDPAFNATINALFTVQERQELAAMLAEVNALISDWEANHKSALGIETGA